MKLKRLTLLPLALVGLLCAASESRPALRLGAEIGTSVDMTGDDMSSLNLDATAGYRLPWLDYLGIGAGAHVMIANSCRYFPVYAMARTSFAAQPGTLFGELRGGMALNRVHSLKPSTDLYMQPGVGMYLAKSPRFTSQLLLSYIYNGMRFPGDKKDTMVRGLNQVSLSVGITF